GLVALWALQTPHHPLRMWKMPAGATALAFSRLQPHLLAIGLYSGMVGVYDVRSATGKAVAESHPITGKHNEPVWQVRWVEKLGGAGGDENLISVSTDGRVTQWALKKGLERTDLMRLKRLPGNHVPLYYYIINTIRRRRRGVRATKRGIISRRAAGLSVDFSPTDASIYICGTEDGYILKCSISYSEQHLEAYSGHRGPVYRLAFSPFAPHIFLSCSADWTVRIWNTEGESSSHPRLFFFFFQGVDSDAVDNYDVCCRESILTLQSCMHQVNDVCWSPLSSTAFAAVTEDGRLDLWDL
ncbi:WD40-repeat-containing domain protein, partial [Pavlovales sp. CCMP2436]